MDEISLGDLPPDRHHRVEREFRVLHDHADAAAANAPHVALGGMRQIDAVEDRAACRHRGIFRQEPQDRPPGTRFARAGLADDAELLAADAQIDAAYGLDRAARAGEADPEIFDLEQRHGVSAAWDRARRATRRRAG